jgi:hypothetical protein
MPSLDCLGEGPIPKSWLGARRQRVTRFACPRRKQFAAKAAPSYASGVPCLRQVGDKSDHRISDLKRVFVGAEERRLVALSFQDVGSQSTAEFLRTTMLTHRKLLRDLVGARGFEPRASCAQGRRATRLRYAPTVAASDSSASCAFGAKGERLRCAKSSRRGDRLTGDRAARSTALGRAEMSRNNEESISPRITTAPLIPRSS